MRENRLYTRRISNKGGGHSHRDLRVLRPRFWLPGNLEPVDGVEALADVGGPVERRDRGLLPLDGGVQLVLDVLPVLHGARLRDFPIPHADVRGMF